MGSDVGLPVRVAAITVPERPGAVLGRVHAQHVGELGEEVGLVERGPELDPIAERLEAHVRVVIKLLPVKEEKLIRACMCARTQ